jgi:dihydropyrimidinase
MPAGEIRTSDDWETGTRAAVCGGTTTVIDFVEPEPGQSLADALAQRRAEAEAASQADFALHMTLRWADDATLNAVAEIVAAGCPSFKAYTTYEGFRLDDPDLLRAMAAVGSAGGLLMVHSENDAMVQDARRRLAAAGELGPAAHPRSRPAESEAEAVGRVLRLARQAACPVYIVHLSTRDGAMAVGAARADGQRAWGESCPQYLVLDEALYRRPGFEGAKFVCSPPLRAPEHAEALWAGLRHGNLATIGTDHCAFNFEGQKDLGRNDFRLIPNGLPGIELRLSLIYTYGVLGHGLSLSDWARLCSTAPAQVFGLYPQKGSLAPGADADVVIFDPNTTWQVRHDDLHEQVDYTPYEGLELTGRTRHVLRGGTLVVEDGAPIGPGSRGKFLPGRL